MRHNRFLHLATATALFALTVACAIPAINIVCDRARQDAALDLTQCGTFIDVKSPIQLKNLQKPTPDRYNTYWIDPLNWRDDILIDYRSDFAIDIIQREYPAGDAPSPWFFAVTVRHPENSKQYRITVPHCKFSVFLDQSTLALTNTPHAIDRFAFQYEWATSHKTGTLRLIGVANGF